MTIENFNAAEALAQISANQLETLEILESLSNSSVLEHIEAICRREAKIIAILEEIAGQEAAFFKEFFKNDL